MSIYNPNIPTGLVNLDVDYQNIQNNFSQLNTSFGVDHTPFSGSSNIGYHGVIHQITQSSPPSLISGINQLFSMNYTPDTTGGTADTQLFSTNGDGGTVQLTGASLQQNGWAWTGGILIQWGIVNMNFTSTGQASGNVTFKNRVAGAIPFPNAVWVVIPTLLTTNNNNSSNNTLSIVNTTIGSLNPPSKTGFSYLFSGHDSTDFTQFFWIAVGF